MNVSISTARSASYTSISSLECEMISSSSRVDRIPLSLVGLCLPSEITAIIGTISIVPCKYENVSIIPAFLFMSRVIFDELSAKMTHYLSIYDPTFPCDGLIYIAYL